MGIINLKVTVGTVNYTDWLHVSAAKVSNPSVSVWETWIDVPFTNNNFIIPNLDPENYIVSYYDAPTNVALGLLRMQLVVNALTNEYIYEKRYYVVGRGLTGDPVDGDTKIIDPYFTNKAIKSIFKQGSHFLRPVDQWNTSTTTTTDDTINILTGVAFVDTEEISVDIQLAAGILGGSSGGTFYAGRKDVTASTYTCLLADRNKRHRLIGTAATQVITLPLVAGLSQEDGYLFDNTCGGVSKCVKILTAGVDIIFYNGFNSASSNLVELWVNKGETLRLAVVDGNYEVVQDYKGTNVGERFAATYKDHPNTLICDGQIGGEALDGDEYGRLWWFLHDILPNTHILVDDTVINTTYVHPVGKEGMWVRHSTQKKFRTGNWQGLGERGLKDFDAYGADATRVHDYPGGKQNSAVGDHRHLTVKGILVGAGGTGPTPSTSIVTQNDYGIGDFKYIFFATGAEPDVSRTGKPINSTTGAAMVSAENIMLNGGVVYVVRF